MGARFDRYPFLKSKNPGQMTLNEQQNVMTGQRLIGAGWINWGNGG